MCFFVIPAIPKGESDPDFVFLCLSCAHGHSPINRQVFQVYSDLQMDRSFEDRIQQFDVAHLKLKDGGGLRCWEMAESQVKIRELYRCDMM